MGKRQNSPHPSSTTLYTLFIRIDSNKKSLPYGKPFIGEHRLMLQPDSNLIIDRNPTQQDKDNKVLA